MLGTKTSAPNRLAFNTLEDGRIICPHGCTEPCFTQSAFETLLSFIEVIKAVQSDIIVHVHDCNCVPVSSVRNGSKDGMVILFDGSSDCISASDAADSLDLDSRLAFRTRVHDVLIPCVLDVSDRQSGTQHLEHRVVVQLVEFFAAFHSDVVQGASEDLDVCVYKVVGQVIDHLVKLVITMLTNTAKADILTNDIRTRHSDNLFS
nr:MAG TPA: hypothetical protein [Caudoviricetes sp.]